jgi:hypothetical protein
MPFAAHGKYGYADWYTIFWTMEPRQVSELRTEYGLISPSRCRFFKAAYGTGASLVAS